MKSEQRNIYVSLVDLGGLGLCDICKHAEFIGYSCCEADLKCHCGIEKVQEFATDVFWEGGDCWAFRPLYDFDDIVDAVGMLMQNIIPDFDTLRKVATLKRKVNNG